MPTYSRMIRIEEKKNTIA